MKAHGEEALTIPFVVLRSGHMQPRSSSFLSVDTLSFSLPIPLQEEIFDTSTFRFLLKAEF